MAQEQAPLPPFIAIEGMDGSGKTTLIRRLQDAFSNEPWFFTREPGGVPLAEKVRSVLLDEASKDFTGRTQLLGFFYSRAILLETIATSRQTGTPVLCDRFDGSTYAYQIYAQTENDSERQRLEQLFWAIRGGLLSQPECQPTLYVYLSLPPEIALARRTNDGSQTQTHYDRRPLEFYERQAVGYREFFGKIAQLSQSDIWHVNAELPPDEVFSLVEKQIRSHMKRFHS